MHAFLPSLTLAEERSLLLRAALLAKRSGDMENASELAGRALALEEAIRLFAAAEECRGDERAVYVREAEACLRYAWVQGKQVSEGKAFNWNVWKSHGLVEDVQASDGPVRHAKGRESFLDELFGSRVDLPDGGHADVLA